MKKVNINERNGQSSFTTESAKPKKAKSSFLSTRHVKFLLSPSAFCTCIFNKQRLFLCCFCLGRLFSNLITIQNAMPTLITSCKSIIKKTIMPIKVSVGNREYESTNRNHAEEVMFGSGRYVAGDFTVNMDGWPCTGERNHDCNALFLRESANRTITVIVSGDHAGYARNHGKNFGSTGTITYRNGIATIT